MSPRASSFAPSLRKSASSSAATLPSSSIRRAGASSVSGRRVWRAYPSAAAFERLRRAPEETARLVRLGARLIAHDLREVGISVDCLPVLDVPVDGSHNIIGDRAYSREPSEIARLGRAAAEGLLDGGVLPVIKHIPGHGRARADSHLELPVVDAPRAELEAQDFIPFRADADLPLGMTAHVVYTAIDPERPGTLSKAVVEGIIRGVIGFDGLLMTDDISMKALSGGFRERAEAALAAGCDVVLHCNGDARRGPRRGGRGGRSRRPGAGAGPRGAGAHRRARGFRSCGRRPAIRRGSCGRRLNGPLSPFPVGGGRERTP